MNVKDGILQQIDELLEIGWQNEQDISKLAFATIGLLQWVYGVRSVQADQVLALQNEHCNGGRPTPGERTTFAFRLRGYLEALKSDVAEGRIVDVQSDAKGEIFGDFIALARRTLNEGGKEVAAVLACAALEDSLKQCAKNHALEVDGKTMLNVVNALKTASVIDKTEGAVLKGFSEVRNNAFHAQWKAIDTPAVTSILAFNEGFLIKHFSSQML